MLVPKLLANSAVGEVIIVDDSAEDFSDLPESERIKILRNERRVGLARSLLIGLHHARYPYILFRDSDLNHSLQDLPVFEAAARRECAVCVASRYKGQIEIKRANDIFSFLLNKFFGARKISDWTYGFFLLRRDLLDSLPSDWIFRGRGEYSIRLYRALLDFYPNLDWEEFSTRVEPRGRGKGTTSIWKHGPAYLRAFLERVPH